MVAELIEFSCPEHGTVLWTVPSALVECRCGKLGVPADVELHKKERNRVLSAKRMRRARA